MKKASRFSAMAVLALCLVFAFMSSVQAAKIKVDKLDDLPRYTYKIDIQAVQLYENAAVLSRLAAEVKRDLLSDLEKYEITDNTTLQAYYSNLGAIAVIDNDWPQYLSYLDKRKALEDKEANRLTTGLSASAVAHAKQQSTGEYRDHVRRFFHDDLAKLPYEVVQDQLKAMKGSIEIVSVNLILGLIEETYQPQLDKSNGEMSETTARALLGRAFTLRYFIPVKDILHDELSQVINAHHEQKPDIWAQREVELKAGEGTTALLAVWDSGVDTAIFAPKGQLWTNSKEIPDNDKDDDHNGYIDDVHGIAYSLHSDKEKALLYSIGEMNVSEEILRQQEKGLMDIQASIDSDEARILRKKLAGLKQEETKPFIEQLSLYGNYAHGTHVAGIVAKGNPWVRILVSRITFDYHMIPEEPTIEKAEKAAKALVETIEYFKQQGVRAVNMSWVGSLASVESALEANNAGGNAEQRKALARKIYDIENKAFRQSIEGAPQILFVTAAGNSDNDVTFEEFYPSSYDYPNIISVGAVDQAGEVTSFTSFGKVDVYANGFEVDSYVPGGERLKLSGTSMASPQVLNLVGKLLAVKPDLTTAELRELVMKGADQAGEDDRLIMLLNQKRSMERLQTGI